MIFKHDPDPYVGTKYLCSQCGYVAQSIQEMSVHLCQPVLTSQSSDDIPYAITFAEYQQLCKHIAALEDRITALEGDGK